MANAPVDPHAEIERLRKQLDTQPSCLMRIGTDGTVLAANDAARNLLGVASLNEVLNVPFTAWLAKASHEPWRLFAERITNGSAASLECEITALSGSHRSALLHGIPVLDHPDRLPSMIVAARDVSDRREIEASLEEREGKIRELELELDNLRSQLVQAQSQLTQAETLRADAERTAAVVRDLEGARATHDAAHAAERARLEDETRRLEERLDQDAARLGERYQRQVDDAAEAGRRWQAESLGLRAAIEQLETSLREREQAVARLEAERVAFTDQLERRTAPGTEQAAEPADAPRDPSGDSSPLGEGPEAQAPALLDLSTAGGELEVALSEKATQLALLAAQHRTLLEKLEGTQAALDREAASKTALAIEHAQALAEQASARQQLESTLAARSADVKEIQAERDRLRQDRDHARAARTALEQSLSEMDHERTRLLASHEDERTRLLAQAGTVTRVEADLEGKDAAIRALETALAAAKEQANRERRDAERDHEQQMAALATQIAKWRGKHDDVDAALRRLETEAAHQAAEWTAGQTERAADQEMRRRVEAELATLAAERHAERAEFEEGRAERLRLEALAQEAESQRHQIEVALEEKTQVLRGELAAQSAALEQAITERRRLHSTLQMRDIAQQALISERTSERQRHQHALAQALAEQERLIKRVADQQVELTAMVEEVHASNRLTAAGRLALDVGRDLRQLLDEVDGHAKALLAECPVDGPGRRSLEALRAEALRAASLGRQFLQAADRQPSLLTADASFATPQRRM